MKPWERNIIDKHFARLVKEIKPKQLMSFLVEKSVIRSDISEETRLSKKPEDINDALLTELKHSSGTMAFKMLIEGLKNTYQASLACLLLEEGKNKMRIIAVCGTNDLTQNSEYKHSGTGK